MFSWLNRIGSHQGQYTQRTRYTVLALINHSHKKMTMYKHSNGLAVSYTLGNDNSLSLIINTPNGRQKFNQLNLLNRLGFLRVFGNNSATQRRYSKTRTVYRSLYCPWVKQGFFKDHKNLFKSLYNESGVGLLVGYWQLEMAFFIVFILNCFGFSEFQSHFAREIILTRLG